MTSVDSQCQTFSSVEELETRLGTLISQQKQLEEAGDYPRAEKCNFQALEVREELRRERLKQFESQQLQQKILLETSQLDEFEAFKLTWDEKIQERKVRDRTILEEVKARNRADLHSLAKRLEASLPMQPKPSGALISLRETEKRAAKAKHYQEAQFCKARANELEQMELEQWMLNRQEKVEREVELRARKQDVEMKNLQQRLQLEMNEMMRVRTYETESLLKKYQNSKSELEVTQGIEKNKMEGKHTTSAGRQSTNSQVISRILLSTKTPETRNGRRISSRNTYRSEG